VRDETLNSKHESFCCCCRECKKSRIFWRWDESVMLIDEQQKSDKIAAAETLSKDELVHFIRGKLGLPS